MLYGNHFKLTKKHRVSVKLQSFLNDCQCNHKHNVLKHGKQYITQFRTKPSLLTFTDTEKCTVCMSKPRFLCVVTPLSNVIGVKPGVKHYDLSYLNTCKLG